MAKIIKNGVTYSDTGAMVASGVTYNNTSSGLSATNAQSAIDETVSNLDTVSSKVDNLVAVTKEYTLSASNWIDDVYTIQDTLITVGTNASTQIISYPSEKYTDPEYSALVDANIRVISVSTGEIQLKAMGGAPSINLLITITYKVEGIPVSLTLDSAPTNGSQNPITSDGVYQALGNSILYNDTTDVALIYNTTYVPSTGINLNYNPYTKLVTVRLQFQVAAALTSGTQYTLATIPNEIKTLIGNHYTWGTGSSNNANTIINILFNTWEDNSVIQITPRAAVSANHYIYGTLTFQAV